MSKLVIDGSGNTPAQILPLTASEQGRQAQHEANAAEAVIRDARINPQLERIEALRRETNELESMEGFTVGVVETLLKEIVAVRRGEPQTSAFTTLANKYDDVRRRFPDPPGGGQP